MQIRASVKVTTPEHPRHDQAGVIEVETAEAIDPENPQPAVLVRFDLGKAAEVVSTADLVQLGPN